MTTMNLHLNPDSAAANFLRVLGQKLANALQIIYAAKEVAAHCEQGAIPEFKDLRRYGLWR